MTGGRFPAAARGLGPYMLAGFLLLVDFLRLSRGLAHPDPDYQTWALSRGLYTDLIWLNIEHYVRAGGFIHPIPYLHDRIEYPVLIGVALWLPSWLPGGLATWFAAAGVMIAAATFGTIRLVRRRDSAAAWWIAASPALLLDGGLNWDLVGIFLLVAAVVWFEEGRYRRSGIAAGVGACFKLFPVVVGPLIVTALVARWWRASTESWAGRGRRGGPEAAAAGAVRSARATLFRWLVPFCAVCVVVFVPALVLAPSNTLWFVRFNSVRPVKDATWILLQNLLGATVVDNHVIDIGSFLIVAAAIVYACWMVWRTADAHQARAVALATALVIIVWMAVNKIWNPQYVLWVFGVAALCSFPPGYGIALGVFTVYDWVFEFVLRLPSRQRAFADVGYGVIAVRGVLFTAMVAWTVIQLHRLVRQPKAVSLDDRLPTAA